MNVDNFKCEKCGGRKSAYFVKAPLRMTLIFIILVSIFIAYFVIDDPGLGLVVMFSGAVASGLLLVTTFRRKCLKCENISKNDIWHIG